MASIAFAEIEAAAVARHGAESLAARLVTPKTRDELQAVPDDRYLSQMSLRVFRAGLKHELVDRKWPAFEEVFHRFDPTRCARLYDEDLEAMLEDKRLIRHMPKLRSVRDNAAAILGVAAEHGSTGSWLAGWPMEDVVGLWEALAKQFSQMGGNSGPAFLRMVGKDTFILTDFVVRGLQRWQAFSGEPRSRKDRQAVQALFNGWAAETGRPLCQLSQILALSAD